MNLTLDRKLDTWTSCNYQGNVLLRCWRTCLHRTSWSVFGAQIRSLETLISRAAPLKVAWLHPSLQGKHLLFEARDLVCLLLLLCLLPMAAVTGDHTFSRFTLSMLKMRSPKWVSPGSYQSTLCSFLKAPGRIHFLAFSETACLSWVVAPSIFKASSTTSSNLSYSLASLFQL